MPQDILDTPTYQGARTAIADAQRSGLAVTLLEAGVDYDLIRRELLGELPPSFIFGLFSPSGANSGAKNSVDRNYLRLAEQSGNVEIRPLHSVECIERQRNGYRVFVNNIDEWGNIVQKLSLSCRYLFLGAGSIGSTQLLLRAQHDGGLGHLPRGIGQWWGSNGNDFSVRLGAGPVGPVMGGPPAVLVEDRDNPVAPTAVEYAGGGQDEGQDILFQLGLAGVGGEGRLRYDADRNAVVAHWPATRQGRVQQALALTYQKLADATPGSINVPPPNSRPLTYHPLGGATIGPVCNHFGRLRGQRGLFVVDSALVRGNVGLRNPALTVAAIAERCMDFILPRMAY